MNYAMTTSDAVAALTLNRLDRRQLYTTPQIDAKLFWLMKRHLQRYMESSLGFRISYLNKILYRQKNYGH